MLGITGGIAAYKTPELVRMLRRRNINVRVAMTKNAERFVTRTTLATVSENRVMTWDWDDATDPLEHITVTRGLDMALVAPATANFIAKMASGVADDLLSTMMLAVECPVFVAPSMNPRMFANPSVQENLGTLAERGIQVIQPDTGDTACGEPGEGRLPEPEHLTAIVEEVLGLHPDFEGKRIVITAGRTEEPIDAVRFISNRSSGKMGIAIAVAARDRGAKVTLIHGPVSEELPEMTKNVAVRRTEEMHDQVIKHFNDCDILIMTAAVADFRPATIFDSKIKRKGDMTIVFSPTPDILESLGRIKKEQLLVGFAAETENHIKNAREKMFRKNLDLICVNDVSRSDIGFESSHNEISFISRNQEIRNSPRLPKGILAHRILDEINRITIQQNRKTISKNG